MLTKYGRRVMELAYEKFVASEPEPIVQLTPGELVSQAALKAEQELGEEAIREHSNFGETSAHQMQRWLQSRCNDQSPGAFGIDVGAEWDEKMSAVIVTFFREYDGAQASRMVYSEAIYTASTDASTWRVFLNDLMAGMTERLGSPMHNRATNEVALKRKRLELKRASEAIDRKISDALLKQRLQELDEEQAVIDSIKETLKRSAK